MNFKKLGPLVLIILMLILNLGGLGAVISAQTEGIKNVYGTVTMSYSEFYNDEFTGEALDENGYYDAVTSATKKKTGIITPILNNTDVFNIEGIRLVDIVVSKAVLEELHLHTKEDILNYLNEKNIEITCLEYENNSITNVEGDLLTSIPVYKAKSLNPDGSYGERILINEEAGQAAPNTEINVNYGTAYGDYQFNFNMSNYTDEYKDNVYAVTLTNKDTNVTYGTVWYEDIWPSSKGGYELQIAVNTTTKVIRNNEVVAGRFIGFGKGNYKAVIMAKGHKDIVIDNIQVDEKLTVEPALKEDTFKGVSSNEISLELDTTNVVNDYVSKLSTANYSLSFGKILIDEREYTVSASNEGKDIRINNINNLVNKYGAGNYTLEINVADYAPVKLSFVLMSTIEQPYLLIDNKIYKNNEFAEVIKGEDIKIVDGMGDFIHNYGSSVTVYVNEVAVPSRGATAVPIIKYDSENETCTILTDNDFFLEEGEHTIKLVSTGYEDFIFNIKLVKEKTKVNNIDNKYLIDETSKEIENNHNAGDLTKSNNKGSNISNAVKTGDVSTLPYILTFATSIGSAIFIRRKFN